MPRVTQAHDESRPNRRRYLVSFGKMLRTRRWALSRRNCKRPSPLNKHDVVRFDRTLEPALSKALTRTLSSKRFAASVRVDVAAVARPKHSPIVRSRCCSMLICWPRMVQKLPCVFTNRHFDCNIFVCDTTGFLVATSRSLTHSTKTPLAASDGSSAAKYRRSVLR